MQNQITDYSSSDQLSYWLFELVVSSCEEHGFMSKKIKLETSVMITFELEAVEMVWQWSCNMECGMILLVISAIAKFQQW